MTQAEVERMQELSDKMDAVAEQASRNYGNTADLTAAERAEWHRLTEKTIDDRTSEVEATHAACGVDERVGADDGRIGVWSDAVW